MHVKKENNQGMYALLSNSLVFSRIFEEYNLQYL